MATPNFDFVIIGGGTSGLVVASRLSEDPNVQVLVLEAGGNHTEDPRVQIPAFFKASPGTELDWGFESEPQEQLKGRRVNYTQGRALGGSSAINALVFVPPSKSVIDSWELLGNPGWNWSALEPYFAKAFCNPSLEPELKRHLGVNWDAERSDAPIHTSYGSGLQEPVSAAWVESFESIGLSMDQNPFSGASSGAFSALSSIDPIAKTRSYAATAYYTPVAHRPNLHVLLNCEVHKIVLDETSSGHRATGVQYKLNNELFTATASREVILAAGTLQSPKLLELSGIGNATLLTSHGIEVKIDNPNVGENLQDHLHCGIGFEAQDHVPTLDALARQEPGVREAAMKEYETIKSGPLAINGVSSYAYLSIKDISPDFTLKAESLLNEDKSMGTLESAYRDLMLKNLSTKELRGAYLTAAAQYTLPVDPDVEGSPKGRLPGNFITIITMLSQPLSRGSVHISSPFPTAKPLINPNFLSHPFDLELFAHQISYIPQIASLPPFASTILKPGGRRRDPKSNFRNLDEAKDFLRTSSIGLWHPCGTCAMLPKEKGGVVDERWRVYGVRGLRVVDASVLPVIPVANIQSSVYAVAERAADIIMVDNGLKGKG